MKKIIFLLMFSWCMHAYAQNLSDGVYTIQNLSTGKMMDISGAATNNGAPLIQWNGNNGRNQLFYVKQLSNGTYIIMNLNSRLNLNVVGNTDPQYNQNGTQVTQYPGEWGAMQWNLSPNANNTGYVVTSAYSGKPIGIYDANNNAVIQWALNAQVDTRFQWNFIKQGNDIKPGRYLIKNKASNQYLSTAGGTAIGGNWIQENYNGQPYFQFDVTINENGNEVITSVTSQQSATVTGNTNPIYNTNGTPLQQWPDQTSPQEWIINKDINPYSSGYYIQSAFSGKYIATYNNGSNSVIQHENDCWCVNNLFEWEFIPVSVHTQPTICSTNQFTPGAQAQSIDCNGIYWHIGGGDAVWFTTNKDTWWTPSYIENSTQHFQAKQLIATRGRVYARTATNMLYEYVDDAWQFTNGWGSDFAIDEAGRNWHIGGNNYIYRRNDDGSWIQIPGQGKQIRANGGTVALIGMDNQLYVWNEDNWNWTFIGGAGIDPSLLPFDVDLDGNVWRIDRVNNNVYFWNSILGWVNTGGANVDRLFVSSTNNQVYVGNGNNVWVYNGVAQGWQGLSLSNVKSLSDDFNSLYIMDNQGNMYITSSCEEATVTGEYFAAPDVVDNGTLAAASSIAAKEFENTSIKIYPNPAKSTVNVALGNRTDKVTIQLFDISGKVKQTNNTGGAIRSLDVSNLSNGMYLLKIYGANGELLKNEKVAVQK